MEFFETKVIKVKKEKREEKCNHLNAKIIEAIQAAIKSRRVGRNKLVYDKERRTIVAVPNPDYHKKGNWVNGENLDKIKFPCFCSYEYMHKKYLGMLNKGWTNEKGYLYELHNINKQADDEGINREFNDDSLKELIENHNIHILKGKIIIFEEA